jgi:integrase
MASIRKRNWRTAKGEHRTAWAVDFVDTNGQRQRKQFESRREADDFRIEIEGQLRSGTFRANAAKVTVKELADLFLRHCEGRMKRRERMTRQNYNTYEGHVINYICPDPERQAQRKRNKRMRPFAQGIGAVKLGQLTARAIGDFRDRLRDAGVSVPTARKVLGTLKVMLEYGISRDLLAVNVARNVKVIGRRDEGAKRIVPPSKEAMRRLIAVADQDFRVKLMFAAATGVRAGELHALRWHHIDFETGEVKIEARVDAYGEEDVTKTAAGMRTVPLGAPVVTALKEWKLRTKRKKPEDLVFPSRRGWYVSHDNMVKRKFLPLFDKLAELHRKEPDRHPEPPARFNWHALRHFAISCWIEAGLSPKTVQTFAGHSSLQVTMDRYGHLFKSDDHKLAMDAIAGEMFG